MNWLYKIRYFIYSWFLFSKKRMKAVERSFLNREGITQHTGDSYSTSFAWGNTTRDNGSVHLPGCVTKSDEGIMLRMYHTETTGRFRDPLNNWEYTYVSREYTSGMVLSEKEQLYGEFACRLICPSFLGAWWAFWSCSQKQWPPEIDWEFFWYKNTKGVSPGHYWGENQSKSMRLVGKALSRVKHLKKGGDIILSYEWRPDFIKWKINGLTVRKVKYEIPRVPMNQIIGLSSHINHDLPKHYSKNQYVGSLIIKWFRAWE